MSGFLVARIRGIEVRVNWSVIVIGALVAWSLAENILPDASEGYQTSEYWIAGVTATIAFFAALVGHEMGHSLVAVGEGVNVKGITLWLFGGVAQLERSPDTPRSALRIAAAGPAVSALIGGIALLIAIPIDGLAGTTLGWLGFINLLLAAFNLLPAFPMDGGRLYQAWLWRRSGDEQTATRRAAEVGQRVGGALVVLGLLEVFLGGGIGGFWLVMVGWFVREAARAELQHVEIERPLRSIPVSEVMSPEPVCVGADTLISEFIVGSLFRGRHASYPVVRGGDVIGVVTIKQVQSVDPDDRTSKKVGDIATPLSEVVVVEPGSSVIELLGELGRRQDRRALVFDQKELIGIVAPSDITRLVTVVELLTHDLDFTSRSEAKKEIPPCSTR